MALTRKGRIILRNAKYERDQSPIEEGCDCYCCKHYSKAYLRHLIKADEILAAMLISEHNIRFSIRLMEDVRKAIEEDRYGDFADELLEGGIYTQ